MCCEAYQARAAVSARLGLHENHCIILVTKTIGLRYDILNCECGNVRNTQYPHEDIKQKFFSINKLCFFYFLQSQSIDAELDTS